MMEAGRYGQMSTRRPTETKPAFRTTEFWIFVGVSLAVLLAGALTGGEGGGDTLNAGQVWLYVVLLAVGYLLSRGIAKAGQSATEWDEAPGATSTVADRVRTAAQVLADGPEAARAEAPTRTRPGVGEPLP